MQSSIGPAAVAVVLVLAPAAANAACARPDLAGRWDAYTIGVEEGEPFWTRCSLRFNAAGRIVSGACRDDEGDGSTLTGQLALKRNCRANGEVTETFAGGSLQCRLNTTLSSGKDVLAGAGSCDEGIIFTLNMVRR